MTDNFFSFVVTDNAGNEYPLSQHQGKCVLVINTASKCGFTPQFEGLEKLWQEYREQGLVVIGFPCNQFNHQDPGTNAEITEFCSLNYGVTFPMMSKIDVNGEDAAPIYRWLRQQAGGILSNSIKWNFTKFLVHPDGLTVERFAPTTKPQKLATAIERALPR